MSTANDLLAGIALCIKHMDGSNSINIGANEDIIYIYDIDQSMELNDIERMIELGFFQEGYVGKEFTPDDYDSEASWWHHV